jgi:hypothetical protein
MLIACIFIFFVSTNQVQKAYLLSLNDKQNQAGNSTDHNIITDPSTGTEISQIAAKRYYQGECNTIEQITSYFLDVYGSDVNGSRSINDIDSFINFSRLKNNNRIFDLNKKKYICKRKQVFKLLCIKSVDD